MNQATDDDDDFLENAHKHCFSNKLEIEQSDVCGCFYCLEIFKPDLISIFTDEDNSEASTALCPFCDIDSVIGSESGLPIGDAGFLEAMKNRFFS